MAQMKSLLTETFNAAAAINNKYRFVSVGAGEYTVQLSAAGEIAVGVNIDTAPAIGRGVAVVTKGNPKVEAGAAFAYGALLKPDATGRAIAAVGGDKYSARARQAATAAGDIVECTLEAGVM
jgi:hypothetical protein